MVAHDFSPTREAWNLYTQGKEVDPRKIPNHVISSWQRCRKLKVDPYCDQQLYSSSTELDQRLDELDELINIALPIMESIYEFVHQSNFQVALSDAHGCLIKVLGNCGTLSESRTDQLYLGANWSELHKGTNAIGTCLIEKKALQIHAWEHFCATNHALTCSAAPIFDPDGNIVGVLDMTGDYRYINHYTMGIVVAGANAIEHQLHLRCVHHKLFAAHKHFDTIAKTMSEGLISVDSQGRITRVNRAACELIDAINYNCVGKHISKVLSNPTPIINMLRTGVDYENQKVVFEEKGRFFYSSGRLIYDEFGNQIGAIAVIKRPSSEQQQPKKGLISIPSCYTFDDIIGDSDVMQAARKRAKIAAKNISTVLLHGESGTGKELFAQSIHALSVRHNNSFVAINCAATPETLIESELFGYEAGAFTGASKGGRAGKIEAANGGTLFLDEIGDMPLHTQVKLLRVLQERKLSRLGATTEISVDIRIIAATNKDLKKEMEAGRFREDLYYRLNVLPIHIPSLRERMQDLPQLVDYLVDKFSLRLDKPQLRVTKAFLKACYAYPWPGNIRELENIIERSIAMVGEDGVLTPELMELDQIATPEVECQPTDIRPLKNMERELLISALKSCRGNIVQASRALGISRNTMYRKIREYKIDL